MNDSIGKKILFWGINVVIACLILLLIGWIVIRQLNNYTRHGFFIEVPDLRGLTPQEALPFSEKKEMNILVVDSIYDKEALPGTIVEQFPSSGSKVKSNRTIQLIINASSVEKVPFPQLRQSSFRQALQRLHNLGFEIGKLKYMPSDFRNLVLGFESEGEPIEVGDLVEKGKTIDIILGSGKQPASVTLPNLFGKTLEEATHLLLHSYLNPGEIIFDNSVQQEADRKKAVVYLQRPDLTSSNRVMQGEEVTLFLTIDPAKRRASQQSEE